MFRRWQIHVYGDSIVRGVSFDQDQFGGKIFCYPGATVRNLRQIIRAQTDFDSTVDAVVIHIGTNNLGNSVWERTGGQYRDLIFSVREKYRESRSCENVKTTHLQNPTSVSLIESDNSDDSDYTSSDESDLEINDRDMQVDDDVHVFETSEGNVREAEITDFSEDETELA